MLEENIPYEKEECYKCTCKEHGCNGTYKNDYCKGRCGCEGCHNEYQDFGYDEYG